ncbi:MAG TPA: hypothetical protein ENH40_01755 [Nitrospirae bacterium]|nr:hypothetical protein [Nitrospirota bacterium]
MHFLDKVSRHFDKKVAGFSPDVINLFEVYPWPGNVRQLHHEIERLLALAPEGEQITLRNCSHDIQRWRQGLQDINQHTSRSLPDRVRELEIRCVNEALRQTGGNKLRASKVLGISRVGLDNKIARYNIVARIKKQIGKQ